MGELHEADIEGAELFTTTSPPIDAPAGVHGQVVVRVRDAFLSALMSLGARKWEHHWPVDELYTCRRTLPLRMLSR
jgi:hypothetical protein